MLISEQWRRARSMTPYLLVIKELLLLVQIDIQ